MIRVGDYVRMKAIPSNIGRSWYTTDILIVIDKKLYNDGISYLLYVNKILGNLDNTIHEERVALCIREIRTLKLKEMLE